MNQTLNRALTETFFAKKATTMNNRAQKWDLTLALKMTKSNFLWSQWPEYGIRPEIYIMLGSAKDE